MDLFNLEVKVKKKVTETLVLGVLADNVFEAFFKVEEALAGRLENGEDIPHNLVWTKEEQDTEVLDIKEIDLTE